MRKLFLFLTAGVLSFLFSQPVHAGPVVAFQLLDNPSFKNETIPEVGKYNYGYEFQVSKPIVINEIGVFDYGLDYFNTQTNTATVSIWNPSDESLVWSKTVSGADVTQGDVFTSITTGKKGAFYWNDLGTNTVSLAPGTYRISATYNTVDSNGDGIQEFASVATDSGAWASDITYNDAVYDLSGPPYPERVSNVTSYAYFGPNFKYSVAPEPQGLALMLMIGVVASGVAFRTKPKTEEQEKEG